MKTFAVTLILVLAGCATGPAYVDSPKLRACKYQATAATTGGTFYGARGVIDGAYAEALAYREILNSCMAQ
jgi:hypothetical protein